MTPMTFIKLCNYCSDVGNVETASAFYATSKQQNKKDIGPGIYQDLLQPRVPCTVNLCALIGIFDPHL